MYIYSFLSVGFAISIKIGVWAPSLYLYFSLFDKRAAKENIEDANRYIRFDCVDMRTTALNDLESFPGSLRYKLSKVHPENLTSTLNLVTGSG